jgi:DsbC/DsbD-like thiol-disulfide interchange protein
MHSNSLPVFRFLAFIFALVLLASSGADAAWALTSPWVAGHKTQVRLEAGRAADGGKLFALVDIQLEPGWKTYWRTPGDAGGLPPSFDWSKSSNLAAAVVMFPAPQRFTDQSGSTIGYHDGLQLPVALTAKNPDEPISLAVEVHYGICKEICVPVEAELTLDIPANEASALSADAVAALDLVPRPQDKLKPGDPVLVAAKSVLSGPAPALTVTARFPGGGEGADAFLEAPDNLYLPVPERVATGADGTITFEAQLGAAVDIAGLKGKPVTVTLVGPSGASVASFPAQ